MNLSQEISLLKQINTSVNTMESYTSVNNAYLKGMVADVLDIKLDVDNINDNLVDIGITLGKTKKYFFSNLTYDGNITLSQNDYTSSPIVGGYYNDTNNPIYINQFRFVYPSTGTPTTAGMYHSTNFTTKFGRYDTDFIEQYRTHTSNINQAKECIRRTYFDTSIFDWTYSWSHNPIQIPIGVTFGHLIAGDFSSGYSSNPMSFIEGYYFD